jgi:hypothetical protein
MEPADDSQLAVMIRKVLGLPKRFFSGWKMNQSQLHITLDNELDVLLRKVCKHSGQLTNDIARDALKRQLRHRLFEEIRKQILPLAQALGYTTDQDIIDEFL